MGETGCTDAVLADVFQVEKTSMRKVFKWRVWDLVCAEVFLTLWVLVISSVSETDDRLFGLVVRVLCHRSGGPGSIPGTNKKKVVGLERGPLSLVSTTEELLDRKVAAPV
jgi:hypothetical protein